MGYKMNSIMKCSKFFVGLVVLLALLSGCGELPPFEEPPANVSQPSNYKLGGLEFKYPSNWRVKVQQSGSFQVPSIRINSPKDAVATIHVFPAENSITLEEYADRIWKTSTPSALLSDSNRTDITKANGFDVMTDHFSIKIIDETLTHERVMRRKEAGNSVLFLTTQVSTRDLANAKPGFDLLVSSVTLKPNVEHANKPKKSSPLENNKTQPKTDPKP